MYLMLKEMKFVVFMKIENLKEIKHHTIGENNTSSKKGKKRQREHLS